MTVKELRKMFDVLPENVQDFSVMLVSGKTKTDEDKKGEYNGYFIGEIHAADEEKSIIFLLPDKKEYLKHKMK